MGKKVGRKKIVITQEIIDKAREYAKRGLTKEQICLALGIGKTAFYRKEAQKKELKNAIKQGRAEGIAIVADDLLKNIKKGNVTAQIFYLKTKGGFKEEQNVNLKMHTGNKVNLDKAIDGIKKSNEMGDKEAPARIYQEMIKATPSTLKKSDIKKSK